MDLAPYFARLALLLPLLCAIIAGGLWLAKKYLGVGFSAGGRPAVNAARVTQTMLLGPGARLAVVEFADRRLLLALGKGGVSTLADAPLAATAIAPPLADETALSPATPFGAAFAQAAQPTATPFSAPFATIRAIASGLGRAAHGR